MNSNFASTSWSMCLYPICAINEVLRLGLSQFCKIEIFFHDFFFSVEVTSFLKVKNNNRNLSGPRINFRINSLTIFTFLSCALICLRFLFLDQF